MYVAFSVDDNVTEASDPLDEQTVITDAESSTSSSYIRQPNACLTKNTVENHAEPLNDSLQIIQNISGSDNNYLIFKTVIAETVSDVLQRLMPNSIPATTNSLTQQQHINDISLPLEFSANLNETNSVTNTNRSSTETSTEYIPVYSRHMETDITNEQITTYSNLKLVKPCSNLHYSSSKESYMSSSLKPAKIQTPVMADNSVTTVKQKSLDYHTLSECKIIVAFYPYF